MKYACLPLPVDSPVLTSQYHQPPSTKTWTRTALITTNISQSGPSLVISNINQTLYTKASRGNIYLVAVRKDSKLQLFWRPSISPSWTAGEIFGSGVDGTPPVMIQDYLGTANEYSYGGFQLVVAVNGSVQHWRRDNGDILANPPAEGVQGRWEMVEAVGVGVRHVWSLVQGSFGGKMHMVTEGVDGSFSYWEWNGAWKVVEVLLGLDDGALEVTGEVTGG
jgi:hypothetical protein